MNLSINVSTPRINRIAVSVFFFIAGLSFSSWASRIPDIQAKLSLSEAQLGGILFALPVGQLTVLPLSGWIINRFGSRQLVIATAILLPLTLLILALANSIMLLATGLFLFGLLLNLLNISMNTQAVGVENIYGKSIMASFHGLWSLAGFSGAAIGSLFVSAGIDPIVHFIIICILTALLVYFFFKHTLPSEMASEKQPPIFVKPDKRILLLGLIAFFCLVCEGAMADWGGVYYKKIIETPASLTNLGFVVFMGTMATGRFIGDRIVTRFGSKKILQVSGLLICTGLLLAVLFPNVYMATAGFLLVGFGGSCVVPVVFAAAGKSDKLPPSMALAAVSTIGFLGFLVGPPLIGFIAEATNLRWSFAIVAMLGLGTTFLARSVKY